VVKQASLMKIAGATGHFMKSRKHSSQTLGSPWIEVTHAWRNLMFKLKNQGTFILVQ
jgi:hypothetical protein